MEWVNANIELPPNRTRSLFVKWIDSLGYNHREVCSFHENYLWDDAKTPNHYFEYYAFNRDNAVYIKDQKGIYWLKED